MRSKKETTEASLLNYVKSLKQKPNSNDNTSTSNQKNKSKKELTFPRWFKLIAYILSFMISSASIVFIIFQGITFGDEKVQKWLTSLLVSFLASIFLTQPIQVSFFAFMLVMIFKSSTIDNENIQTSHESSVQDDTINNSEFMDINYERNYDEPLNGKELEAIRSRNKKEAQIKRNITRICVNLIFLLVIYFVSYTNRDLNSFKYQHMLKNLVLYRKTTDTSYNQVKYSFSLILFFDIFEFFFLI